jgi:hypothetical protein
MLFTELKIGNESYKLRLTTKVSIALEKSLGFNPLTMLMEIDNGVMPKLGDCLIMLHAMLQTYHHGMNMDKVYDLFDAYVADGHNMFDLIPVFIKVFEQSGYITSSENAEAEAEKN